MARQLNKLSPKFVETIEKPGRFCDGGGLYLQITGSRDGGVSKSWLFRYMRGGTTSREMGLGGCSLIKGDGYTTLAQARRKRSQAREMLEAGLDPLEAKRAGKLAIKLDMARSVTFSHCTSEYVKEHQAQWGGKHTKSWTGTLNKHALPVIGGLPVAAIDTALVLKVLKPLWHDKTKTAVDVRSRLELILNWAKVHGYRDGENPARWRGHLENALPKPRKIAKVKHLAAVPYDEVPAVTGELRKNSTVEALALHWTVVAATRTAETLGAVWSEIDLEKKTWTIPASRMKADVDHKVPLSDTMLAILKKLPRDTDLVFSKDGRRLPHDAMLWVLRPIRQGVTVHGFRSSFRDWAAETTAYPSEVIEMALAHAIGNAVEAAYRRGDLFEKRRRLMADWAAYCASGTGGNADNVVTLRAAQ